MSNLGWYQVITTIAKKVGGPKVFLGLTLISGAILGVGTYIGGEKCVKKIKDVQDKNHKENEAANIYTVNKNGENNEGLLFQIGDRFRVIAKDGDVGLIEIIGKDNNPYYVSLKYLSSLSDYVII